MQRVFFLFTVLSFASAVDFKNAVVITSADVPVDQEFLLNLQSGDAYRVYATFASGNGNEEYAKNVKIYDYSGASLTVYGLDQPKPNSGSYFLDNLRYLRAPIYVRDTNNGAAVRVPFTIYVVGAGIVSFPVVSARNAPLQVDSNSNPFVAAGLTVLSAEEYFTMSSFDIGSMSSMVISSVGFDESDPKYNVMSLDSGNDVRQSFLTIYGPITTLFNAKWGINARFQFQFTRNTKYDYSLAPGASFSLLSPGYLSADKSYQIPYPATDALTRSFIFGQNNYVNVWYQVRDIQAGESINFQFTTSDGQPSNIDLTSDQQSWVGQWANKVALNVKNTNGNHVPRYLFQITSGSSLSFSLLGVLLVSLFSRF